MTLAVVPASPDEACEALARASAAGRTVGVVGGGTRGRRGAAGQPDLELRTGGLRAIVDYEPADLTVTVQAGLGVCDLAATLAERGQAWPQADLRPGSTVGGVLATAASGHARLRYGAVRDSLLEVVVATGDGRHVMAGGRTVKGVDGYDLCRLTVGALGTLGVIVQATLKLWPLPPARSWFHAPCARADALALGARVLATVVRPLAVLVDAAGLWVELAGPAEDVVAPAGMTAGARPAEPSGRALVQLGVPPGALGALVRDLPAGAAFMAEMGVGSCRVVAETGEEIARLRSLAEARGGYGRILDAPDEMREHARAAALPGLAIMRRLKQAFDPAGVLNPGLAPWELP